MFSSRIATEADLPVLRQLMTLAIERLLADFLSPDAVAASHAVMGLDTQLVTDRTYFVIEEAGVIVGCGGWSRRATLYGGDHTEGTRDDSVLDPAVDAARTRAMYTHPDHARRGIGRMILALCEAHAAAEGFTRMELMATAGGEPLYRAAGYSVIAEAPRTVGTAVVPLTRMGKTIAPAV